MVVLFIRWEATENLDTGDYTALYSESTEPNTATPGYNIAFWFPDGEIKKGDLVVLYTKSGNEAKKAIGDGRTAHFYYWGLSKPLWGVSTVALVLIEAADWVLKWPAETLEPEEPKRSLPAPPPGKPSD